MTAIRTGATGEKRGERGLIELTLATEFLPGTNLAGDKAHADWRFMLPHLRSEKVLWIGRPKAGAAAVLAASNDHLYLVWECQPTLQQVLVRCKAQGLDNITAILADKLPEMPLANASVDTVYLSGQLPRSTPAPLLRSELQRVMRPDAVIYSELPRWNDSARRRVLAPLAKFSDGDSTRFWLSPLSGEVATAAPLKNVYISAYFFTNVLYGQSLKKRTLSRLGLMASRLGLLDLIAPRRAQLTVRGGNERTAATHMPKYLITLAERSGIDLSNCRFGLSARGRGNSNKVIFFVFREAARTPETVIKITRAQKYNFRLENEFEVLCRLRDADYVDSATYPDPLFLGHEDKLAVLGLRGIEGRPFRAATSATPHCPIARDAMDWLLRLGERSASHNARSAIDAYAAMLELFKRFNRLYTLPDQQRSVLEEQIQRFDGEAMKFPVVLQHGDPGTWNMMVDSRGRVIVVDWEGGEPQGMPLWDLFYFFRTYASWVSRMEGSRDSLESFRSHFLRPAALGTLLNDYVRRYCEATSLDPALVQPLFFTCWMHRALKEATRLHADTLDKGHFVNLLQLVIDQRHAICV